MRRLLLVTVVLCAFSQRRERLPATVTPGPQPSDAIILFDGRDLAQWQAADGTPSGCVVDGGEMLCRTGSRDAVSRQMFRDAQIHLEFKIPYMPAEHGQSRGNSGVYLHGLYEIQVLDSFENPTYSNGSCGALYGQAAPLVNVSLPPEQWQTYDILFRAPRCEDGQVRQKAVVTVLQNGIVVQDHVAIEASKCQETGPLLLQDHNYPGAPLTLMRFRNVWFRPLQGRATEESLR
jgi:hypothetical protein